MDFEELASANSEIRFLTIELMKIAANRGVPFDSVLSEFVSNAYVLKKALKKSPASAVKQGAKDAAALEKALSRAPR